MKAVPRSCTIDWGIPYGWHYFSTAEIVAWAPVLVTGYTIRKREKASIITRQWRLRLLGGGGGVNRSLVINMDCLERYCLVLPFFQWNLIPVFRLWFVVLASQAISSECANPVKHTRPVVESFCIVIGFWNSHVSTHFVVVSKSEAC